MNNRTDIKDFITFIESNFSVNEWRINDILIWPIIRIRLYFFLIHKLEYKSDLKKQKTNQAKAKKKPLTALLLNKVKTFIKRLFYIYRFIVWYFNLPQRDFLFLGGDVHRIDYKNSRFNRFFDVLIEKYQIKNNSLYFEYGKHKLKNQHHPQNVRFHEIYYKYFKVIDKLIKHKDTIYLQGYEKFEKYLRDNPLTVGFVDKFNKQSLELSLKENFSPKLRFYNLLLRRVQPKQIHFLCYYSGSNFPLLAVAYKKNIKTVEMQHGPQTDIHLAYGSWSTVPKDGYPVIPKEYWCWEKASSNVFKKWAQHNDYHDVRVIGHPWVDYWKEKKQDDNDKKYILYSLQPQPVQIDQLFTDDIINIIKKSNENWLIRLHPRQLDEKEIIIKLLKENKIFNKSNLEYASQESLPKLLIKSKLNLTHYSGTTIESSLFDVKTILLNEVGLRSFPELIKNKNALYIDYQDKNFEAKFNKVLKNLDTSLEYHSSKRILNQKLFPI